MTYIAVDTMRKDKGGNGGTIVNVSSVAGDEFSVFVGFTGKTHFDTSVMFCREITDLNIY